MSKRERFDPLWEETNIVLVDDGAIRKAERHISSCEACKRDEAQIPFDHVLDRVTGSDPLVTDYVLSRPAQCPRCKGGVGEKTLVDLKDDDDREEAGASDPLLSAKQ